MRVTPYCFVKTLCLFILFLACCFLMISDSKTANAMGGKTARPCDGCLHKRARWYCGADDAFLCQSCDTSVHSANQLASRHERVRLETASSFKLFNAPQASWQGFTRKARTPRQNKQQKGLGSINPIGPLVPEVGSEEGSLSVDENDEQVVCRVPVFDPFSEELCVELGLPNENETICEFLPSDLDLSEFERLLGVGHDEESRGIIKEEQEDQEGIAACFFEPDFDVTRESSNWSFYDGSSPTITEVEEKVVPVVETKRTKLLRLNCESVITAWASQGSPWTTGTRPEFDPDDFMGLNPEEEHHMNGGILYMHARGNNNTDGEREARVSRYREKRRTRLFSKKIRYQVRKLNAEKRPRMKGRFVKRTSFVGNGTGFP